MCRVVYNVRAYIKYSTERTLTKYYVCMYNIEQLQTVVTCWCVSHE